MRLKRLLPLLTLLFISFTAFSTPGDVIYGLVNITNTPVAGATITINGNLRTWVTNAPNPLNQILIGTNSAASSTNLYSAFNSIKVTGLEISRQNATCVMWRTAPDGNITISLSSGWGTVTYMTNTPALGLGVRVPLTVEDWAQRTNIASEIISAINQPANTNAINPDSTAASALKSYIGASTNKNFLSAKQYTDVSTNTLWIDFLSSMSEINVLNFGASTNIADNGPAFTAAFQAVPRLSTWKYGAIGGRVKIPAGIYKFETSAVIPQDIGLYAHLEVDGYGAWLTTTNAIAILDRWPTNRSEVEFTEEAKIFIRGLTFQGTGNGTNGTGIRLSATYGGSVEDCTFWTLSAGLDAYFTIALEVDHNSFTYAPLRIQAGTNDLTGLGYPGTEIPSQSNHSVVRHSRFRSFPGQPYNMMLLDSSNLQVEDCIFEGSNPTNNVYVRVNEPITFRNLHVENAAIEAFFRFENLSRLVTVTIDGFEPNECNLPSAVSTLAMVVTNCDNPIFNIYNWQAVDCYPLFDASSRRLSNGTLGQPGQSGWYWNFVSSGGQQDCNWTDPKYWVGGIVPTNMTIIGERSGFSYHNQLRVGAIRGNGANLTNIPYSAIPGMVNTLQYISNTLPTLVLTNDNRVLSFYDAVGLGTAGVPGRALTVNGFLDLKSGFGAFFAGYEGDYSYQISTIVNGMAYDTWSDHVFRYGANGAESIALLIRSQNAALTGWLSAAGYTNSGFSGGTFVLTSDAQKRIVESSTTLASLATDAEVTAATANLVQTNDPRTLSLMGNVGIGKIPGSKLDVAGEIRAGSARVTNTWDGGMTQFGEVLTTWTVGSGWTSNSTHTFTHTASGGTAWVTNDFVPANGTAYFIDTTIAGRTAGAITLYFGGNTSIAIGSSYKWGPTTVNTTGFAAIPTTDFNGTCTFSIKKIDASGSLVNLKVFDTQSGSFFETRGNVNQANIGIGYWTGMSWMPGSVGNTALGHAAQSYTTTGYENTGIGYAAQNILQTGIRNVAVGAVSQRFLTTGQGNVHVGAYSGRNLTTGVYNTGVGNQVQQGLTSGEGNVALGTYAQYNIAASVLNTSIGYWTSYLLNGGQQNVHVGAYSDYYGVTNNYNSALGYASLYQSLNHGNSALGWWSLGFLDEGGTNVGIGLRAGAGTSATDNNSSRKDNWMTFIGAYAGRSPLISYSTSISNGIAIGAGAKVPASNKAKIGNGVDVIIDGYSSSGGITNTLFSGDGSILVSDSQKRIVESGTSIAGLATDAEITQATNDLHTILDQVDQDLQQQINEIVFNDPSNSVTASQVTNIWRGLFATEGVIITNGLAGTNYVNSITNGLATTNWTLLQLSPYATTNWVSNFLLNYATTNFVTDLTNTLWIDALAAMENRLKTNDSRAAAITNTVVANDFKLHNGTAIATSIDVDQALSTAEEYTDAGTNGAYLSAVAYANANDDDTLQLLGQEAVSGTFAVWGGSAWVLQGGDGSGGPVNYDLLMYQSGAWTRTNNLHPGHIGSGGASEGNYLRFDGTHWGPGQIDLADIQPGLAELGQFPKLVGGVWQPVNLLLSDIGASGATGGQFPRWNSSEWVPSNLDWTDLPYGIPLDKITGSAPPYAGPGDYYLPLYDGETWQWGKVTTDLMDSSLDTIYRADTTASVTGGGGVSITPQPQPNGGTNYVVSVAVSPGGITSINNQSTTTDYLTLLSTPLSNGSSMTYQITLGGWDTSHTSVIKWDIKGMIYRNGGVLILDSISGSAPELQILLNTDTGNVEFGLSPGGGTINYVGFFIGHSYP